MKEGRSLSELAQELERQQDLKRDVVADTRQIWMEQDGSGLVVPVTDPETGLVTELSSTITEHTHGQIGDRVGIPRKYYSRLQQEAPALLAQNVNHWFHEKSERRMVRTLDGRARAFVSDRYQRIDNYEIASLVLPLAQELGEVEVASCEVTERRMFLKFVTPRIMAEVKKGDPVQAGLVISNSEIGLGSLKIEPLIYRLVCLNGMIRGVSLRKYHVGTRQEEGELEQILSDTTRKLQDKATISQIRDVMRAAVTREVFEKTVRELQETTEQKIEGNPVKAVEVLSNTLVLTQEENDGVLRELVQGGDLSRYGLLNAVTAFSQKVESYDRATELEQAGGKVLELNRDQWKEIAEAA